MPTTILGRNLLVFTGATPVAISCQGEAELSVETEQQEAVCKDSGAWSEAVPGKNSWSIDLSNCVLQFDATNGITQIMDAFLNATKLKVAFTTGVTGDRRAKGDAYVTSISINAPVSGPATYNITFTGTGPLTYEVV